MELDDKGQDQGKDDVKGNESFANPS